MSRRFNPKYDGPAMKKCESLGLHPIFAPMGDNHHTDAPVTKEDQEIGDALAYFLGGIFIDKEEGDPDVPLRGTYWYSEMSPVDVWTRVARALRIHGLSIADRH